MPDTRHSLQLTEIGLAVGLLHRHQGLRVAGDSTPSPSGTLLSSLWPVAPRPGQSHQSHSGLPCTVARAAACSKGA